MEAYILLSYLQNLTLVGQNEDGDLEWVGTRSDWDLQVNTEKEYVNEK